MWSRAKPRNNTCFPGLHGWRRSPSTPESCLRTNDWVCCRAKSGEPYRNDLPSVPERRMFSLASKWRRRLPMDNIWAAAVALPYLRQAVLRRVRGALFFALRALPEVRKFRFGPYLEREGRAGVVHPPKALARLPGLSVRAMPAKVLQRPAFPANRSVDFAARLRTQPGHLKVLRVLKSPMFRAILATCDF